MERRLTYRQITYLADNLRGTCNSLDEMLERLFDVEFHELTNVEFDELDDLIFECHECGWWCDSGELSSIDDVCSDCHRDEDYG